MFPTFSLQLPPIDKRSCCFEGNILQGQGPPDARLRDCPGKPSIQDALRAIVVAAVHDFQAQTI